MQVELLEAKTETFKCRHLARHGSGLRPAAGQRRLGHARSSFYAMTSGQHAEQPPAKRRGPKPAISDQALLVAIEADLEATPWEGEGYGKIWATTSGLSRHPGCPQAGAPPDAREQSASPHRCRRRGGNPHDGEIITHAPTSCPNGGRRLGRQSPPSSGTPSVSDVWRGDRFAALQPISMATAAGAARGLALRMDHGLSDHFDQVLGHPGPTPSSPSPRPTASPSGSIARLPTSRSCGTPSATSNSTMPRDRPAT